MIYGDVKVNWVVEDDANVFAGISNQGYQRIICLDPGEYKGNPNEFETQIIIHNSFQLPPTRKIPDINRACPLLQEMFWRSVENETGMAFVESDEIEELESQFQKPISNLLNELWSDVKKFNLEGIVEDGAGEGCLLIGYSILETCFKWREGNE